ERTAPGGELLLQAPDLSAGDRIPRVELAAVTSRSRVHLDVCADERRPLDVVGLDALLVLAEVVVRNVEKTRVRREGRWLPVLPARRRRADVANDSADAGL